MDAYMVLSITDLKRALAAAKAARKSSKFRSRGDAFCIVLRDISVKEVGSDGPQISSPDFNSEIERIHRMANEGSPEEISEGSL